MRLGRLPTVSVFPADFQVFITISVIQLWLARWHPEFTLLHFEHCWDIITHPARWSKVISIKFFSPPKSSIWTLAESICLAAFKTLISAAVTKSSSPAAPNHTPVGDQQSVHLTLILLIANPGENSSSPTHTQCQIVAVHQPDQSLL